MEIIGSKILNYNILSLIGEGGMASVYLGEHDRLGTKVAVKILNPLLSVNVQLRERFLNEAKLMASLDHPNITKVLDFEDEGNILCIVMEYLEGEDLSELIKRTGALPNHQINAIYNQVLAGFQYAHSKGVVHRDIKPSNIFIRLDGVIKILDFGIAKLFGQGNEMTQTGTQMGTPMYMSPEQVKADKSIDFRSDIYSLGVTLFYACNGHPPYDADTLSQFDILSKIVHEPIPEMKSNPYKHLILTACAKDREHRFQSCEEWLEQLNRIDFNEKATEIERIPNSQPIAPPIVEHPLPSPVNTPVPAAPEKSQSQEIQPKSYKRVKFNQQIWMTENLALSNFSNGDAIMQARTNEEWDAAIKDGIPAYCLVNNSENKKEIYGFLYNWFAVNDPRGLAPKGWRIPNKKDFETLIHCIGGVKQGVKLKHHLGWDSNNGIENEHFKAPAAGTRTQNGEYKKVGQIGALWSISQINTTETIAMILSSSDNNIMLIGTDKGRGLSVRCISTN